MYEIVTIIDLSARAPELINRARKIISEISNTDFKLTIGHMNRGSKYDLFFIKLIEKNKLSNIKLVSIKSTNDAPVALSVLRNVAIESVISERFIIIDIDIYPDLNLFRNLIDKISSTTPFVITPCIYLTKAGNKLIEKGLKEYVIRTSLQFSSKYVIHWAIPSSVIALRKIDWESVSGFYVGYSGHGYEDFDFIIRLALHLGILVKTQKLLIDQPYRAPLLSEGFRSFLGCFCIDNLLEGNIAFHLYHSKDKNSKYYSQRSKNSDIFTQRLRDLIQDSDSIYQSNNDNILPPLILKFFIECHKRNINPSKYHALFDARPRYLLRPRSIWKRLKNLMIY